MIYGYARVSTIEQNLDRQLEALNKFGCEVIYSDKLTGATKERPQLVALFDVLKEGDTIVITDLTRFSRSTRDLFDLVDVIKEKKANIKSLKDTWLDLSSDNPYGEFLFTVMSAVSQLERDLTKMRQKEGIAIAKKKGVLVFSDATQAVGKIPVNVNTDGIDLMAFTAHKMYGPKGVGALYVRRKNPRVKVTAQIDGGGHERGMRSGTLNVPGIVGFGKACEICLNEMEEEGKRLRAMRDKLENALLTIEEAYLNGDTPRQ